MKPWGIWVKSMRTLLWRHNGRDGVSNHWLHHWLLKRLFRRRSKKTSKRRVTGLCAGNSPVNSPHRWPVTRKMFPFHDVITLTTTKPGSVNSLCVLDVLFCVPLHDINLTTLSFLFPTDPILFSTICYPNICLVYPMSVQIHPMNFPCQRMHRMPLDAKSITAYGFKARFVNLVVDQ